MALLKADCKKFSPNIFNKRKCQNCFRAKDVHSPEALENNRVTRKACFCGYLFIAPGNDTSFLINKSKRWQRRWFVLYDDGELAYSVDEHPQTVPQAIIDMNCVLEVSDAENVIGNQFALAVTTPENVYFIKGTSKEEAKRWLEALSAFCKNTVCRKYKRSFTLPCTNKSPKGSDRILTSTCRRETVQVTPESHLKVNSNFTIVDCQNKNGEIKETCVSTQGNASSHKMNSEQHLNNSINESKIQSCPLSKGRELRKDILDPFSSVTDTEVRGDPDGCNPESLQSYCSVSPTEYIEQKSELLKKGWLVKHDKNSWNKHWFVLKNSSLTYYNDPIAEDSGALNGVVNLQRVTDVTEVKSCSGYMFCLLIKGDSQLYLSAVSSKVRLNWMQTILKAIEMGKIVDNKDCDLNEKASNMFILSDSGVSSLYHSNENSKDPLTFPSRTSFTKDEDQQMKIQCSHILPSSPPLARTVISKVKERSRSRSKSSKHNVLDIQSSSQSSLANSDNEICDSSNSSANACPDLEEQKHSKEEQFEDEKLRLKQELKSMKKLLQCLEDQYSHEIDDLREQYQKKLYQQRSSMEEETLKHRYRAEVDQMKTLYEKGLEAMELSHKQIVSELERKHQNEISDMLIEKERMLSEEAHATALALETVRKAHKDELEWQIKRFKEDFVQKMNLRIQTESLKKGFEIEMSKVKKEILVMTEKYSIKTFENIHLRENLASVNEQLNEANYQILQLLVENKQLKALLASDPVQKHEELF